jgi:hypothetical protein
MKRIGAVLFAPVLATTLCSAAIGCANVSGDDLGLITERKVQPPGELVLQCRVTGGGQILTGDSPDSFGGNAQPFRDGVDGEWNHVTHDGDYFHGDPSFIQCFDVAGAPAAPPDAPANAIWFSGTGGWNDEEGCTFSVWIEDHSEPGTSDFYMIDVSCENGESYHAGNVLLHGNLQIHDVPAGHIAR